jgi:hypothetical protein
VSALTTRLSASSGVRVKRADVRAYDLYLKGRFQWNKRTNAAMQEAIALFTQALEIDPD